MEIKHCTKVLKTTEAFKVNFCFFHRFTLKTGKVSPEVARHSATEMEKRVDHIPEGIPKEDGL